MTRSEHILEAARSIRPELSELIGGPDADALDRELETDWRAEGRRPWSEVKDVVRRGYEWESRVHGSN